MGLPFIILVISICLFNAFYLCLEFSMSDFEFPSLTASSACRLMIVSSCHGCD